MKTLSTVFLVVIFSILAVVQFEIFKMFYTNNYEEFRIEYNNKVLNPKVFSINLFIATLLADICIIYLIRMLWSS